MKFKINISNSGTSYGNTQNNGLGALQKIESSTINNFQTDEYNDFIKSISKIIILNEISEIFIILGICCFFKIYFMIFLIIGLFLNIYLRIKCRNNMYYEIDEDETKIYEIRKNSLLSLNLSKKIWQIPSFRAVNNKKINAGAGHVVNRKSVRFTTKSPFYLSPNIQIISIKLKKERLYFLPDKILIVRGHKVGTIEYSELKVYTRYTIFIESDSVPKDATIIGHTWQYVNKNGNPDKRFKNNRKIPKCKYGEIIIKTENGLKIDLMLSNYHIAENFKNEDIFPLNSKLNNTNSNSLDKLKV